MCSLTRPRLLWLLFISCPSSTRSEDSLMRILSSRISLDSWGTRSLSLGMWHQGHQGPCVVRLLPGRDMVTVTKGIGCLLDCNDFLGRGVLQGQWHGCSRTQIPVADTRKPALCDHLLERLRSPEVTKADPHRLQVCGHANLRSPP